MEDIFERIRECDSDETSHIDCHLQGDIPGGVSSAVRLKDVVRPILGLGKIIAFTSLVGMLVVFLLCRYPHDYSKVKQAGTDHSSGVVSLSSVSAGSSNEKSNFPESALESILDSIAKLVPPPETQLLTQTTATTTTTTTKTTEATTHQPLIPHRVASFFVIGDWGWDAHQHGNFESSRCQKDIANLMATKFDELGDVQFVINVGDSFYPAGVKSKDDPQWDLKWRTIYSPPLRSVPWYSVYGNHDYRSDPCACSESKELCAQVNENIYDLEYFYMPSWNWWLEHPELDLEVIGLDMNRYMGSFQGHPMPIDCMHTKCMAQCLKNLIGRSEEAMVMFSDRIVKSTAKNMLVFSHYPTDYFGPLPEFVANLSDPTVRTVTYFGGHRHDVDQDTRSTSPNTNWLVGGGGGWGCDGQNQGFVVGEIDSNKNLKTYSVLVDPVKCCR